jgi:hypothetical protein
VVTGQVLCRHCKYRIVSDGRGDWVHLGGGYTCRNEANVLLSTHAEPPPPPEWPINPVHREFGGGSR